MTIQIILPSKRVIDVHPLIVDFVQELEEGETLVSVAVDVTLYTGEDPDPSNLLYLPPDILGTKVEQRLKEGIPGNIYTVTLSALTTEDRTLDACAFQAVLPLEVPAEDIFIPLYLTSRPYPLDVVEEATLALLIEEALTLSPDIGAVLLGFTLESGTLRPLLVEYSNALPEGFDHTFDLVSGTMRDVLVEYTDALPEGVDHAFTLLSGGYLKNIFIQYTNWPAEGINSSLNLLSGTLA